MDTLTVTLRTGRLTFSRAVYLGTTYSVEFAGELVANATGLLLTVTGRDTKIALAQSVTEGESTTIAFDTEELIREFRGCGGESIGFFAWLSGAAGTEGHGTLAVNWSPLVVDLETGTAASLKGDAGVGIASLVKIGQAIVFTLTNGNTQTVSIADMKGDKGDTGNTVGTEAAALIAALPDGEPANLGEIYAQLAAVKTILKGLNT